PSIALAVIVTCQLMITLDATVVNVALPRIQSSLHFSPTNLSWVLNAYTLAVGGLLLLGGRAGDILGRRRLFIGGIALFTLASLLGGFATSSWWLLASRAAQGVGAAAAAPGALALIATNFEEGPARNRALGVFSAVAATGGSIGLILGGVLTSWVSWRWVLFINVPIGIAVIALAPLFVRESDRHPGRFDLLGALTSTFGMTSLVYGFIRAASNGWSDSVARLALAVAAVLLALFLSVEIRARQPIVPLRLFANRNRAGAYLNMLLLPATMFGMFFFLTQFVQDVLGFSPITAGFAFLPLTLAIFTASRIVPRLLPRFGPKPFLVGGATLILAGMIWLTQISSGTTYAQGLLAPMLLFGFGAGCSFMPVTMTILAGVPRQESGAASGLLQTMQQVGGALGVAILVTVFGTASRDAARHPLASATPTMQAHHIMAHGVASAFTISTIFASCTLLIALFVIRARATSTQ
ncbi:MAG TPA: MFS transporter, partial [Chloroflexota bacterium]